jgi:hypothetical protein
MPVKVFNQTSGRDEEKVFGENTNRCFESIEVPVALKTLKNFVLNSKQLQRQSDELTLAQFPQGRCPGFEKYGRAHVSIAQHAEQVVR